MKKFMAVLISAFLVISLSTVAFAAPVEANSLLPKYKVAFAFVGEVPVGATPPKTVEIKWGRAVLASAGAVTTYKDWTFNGWHWGGGTVFQFYDGIGDITDGFKFDLIFHDETLKGTWTCNKDYTVSYNFIGDAPSDAEMKNDIVHSGYSVSKPADPTTTLPSWTFDGWYTKSDCTGEKYVFNTAVTDNVELYGQWTKDSNSYTVTFTFDGDKPSVVNKPKDQTIKSGDLATDPEVPSKTGFWDFDGWYEQGSETEFDFTTPITTNTDLHATWVYEGPYVTLNYHSSSDGESIRTPDVDTTVDELPYNPKAPSISGYKFVGWYCRELQMKAMASEAAIKADDSENKVDIKDFIKYVPSNDPESYYYPSELYGFYEVSSSSSSTPAKKSSEVAEKDEVSIWGEVKFIPEEKAPLASAPSVTIPEAPVALAGPKTGSGMAIASYLTFVTGALGMAYMTIKSKKK